MKEYLGDNTPCAMDSKTDICSEMCGTGMEMDASAIADSINNAINDNPYVHEGVIGGTALTRTVKKRSMYG